MSEALFPRVIGPAFAALPAPVRAFQVRAVAAAVRARDPWTLRVATRPAELGALLAAARGAGTVVEVGTASAWTSASLALAAPGATVHTFDPVAHPHRDRYLALLPPAARARVVLHARPGEDPGPDPRAAADLLFVDGPHDAASTAACFTAWRDRLAPGAAVAFHDFDDPAYPGVREAVTALGLLPGGRAHGRLLVWRAPAG